MNNDLLCHSLFVRLNAVFFLTVIEGNFYLKEALSIRINVTNVVSLPMKIFNENPLTRAKALGYL